MDSKETLDRKLQLSSMFMQMGDSLLKEGREKNVFSIVQSGNIFLLLSALMLNDVDFFEFANICSMYSSKKILDELEATNSDISKYLKSKTSDETYDDFIKRINKLRDGDK
jgi:hypothetical protein